MTTQDTIDMLTQSVNPLNKPVKFDELVKALDDCHYTNNCESCDKKSECTRLYDRVIKHARV